VLVFALQDEAYGDGGNRSQSWVRLFETRGPSRFGYAPGLLKALLDSGADVVHLQGLWQFPSVACRRWARKTGKPYLVSPHGMLDPWALRNAAWKKSVAAWLYENRNLRDAACLHALSKGEAASFRRLGLKNPIAVIPNGVEPAAEREAGLPSWAGQIPAEEKVLLYLGRLHPKKGLRNLLTAWAQVGSEAAQSGWRLVICGWGQDGHEREIQSLARELKLTETVHFAGPQFGRAKEASYARASAFVLPSLSEGMPVSVIEAWSWGLPALITPACNLPEGYESGAALRVEAEPESIAEGLKRLFAMGEEDRRRAGEAGRRLAGERFSWKAAAVQMKRVYEWVAGRGPEPPGILV